MCITIRASDTTVETDVVWAIQGSSCRGFKYVTHRFCILQDPCPTHICCVSDTRQLMHICDSHHHCKVLYNLVCSAVTYTAVTPEACLKNAPATSEYGFYCLQIDPVKVSCAALQLSYNFDKQSLWNVCQVAQVLRTMVSVKAATYGS